MLKPKMNVPKRIVQSALVSFLIAAGITGAALFSPLLNEQHYLNPGSVAAAGRSVPVNTTVKPMQMSLPTRLLIPKIGVNAPVIQLGLNSDGTLQTPYSQIG